MLRGHGKKITLMLGINEDVAIEITCRGGNMRLVEWKSISGTMPKSLTQRMDGSDEPRLVAIEE